MWWIIAFAVLLIIVWLFAMKLFPHTVTWKEGVLILCVQSVIIGAIVFGSLYGQGSDTQIVNGEVTGKERDVVSCEHSYSCNCITTCSGKGACSTICQTCYEHSFDVDWIVNSNVGSLLIDRTDRQGLKEPKRWSDVKIGEPFAAERNYYNYIKASPFSIFNKSQIEDKTAIPSYLRVHDYYRVQRVINYNAAYKNDDLLNDLLNESLKKLGPQKKVNIVVVLHSKGGMFSEALRAKQLGGKINDVFVVIDINNDGVFNGVNVFSWSKTDQVNVMVRDSLLDIGRYDAIAMNSAISNNIARYYQHRSIEEFKYLEDDVQIPKYAVWLLIVFGILFPFVGAYVAHKHEIA